MKAYARTTSTTGPLRGLRIHIEVVLIRVERFRGQVEGRAFELWNAPRMHLLRLQGSEACSGAIARKPLRP